MNSRGISPLIASVLLIAFTMAVAGLFSSWAPGLLQGIQSDTSEDTESLLDATKAGLEVDSAVFDSDTGNTSVVFRNTGQVELSNFTVTARLEDGSFVQKRVDQELDSAGIVSVELNTSGVPDLVRVDSENLDVSAETQSVSGAGSTSNDGGSGGSVDFQLSGVGDDGPVTEGGTVSVDYTVSNDGGVSGVQDVVLDVSGVQEDVDSSVSLSSSGSSSGSLSWSTSSGDAGSYSYTVSTENDSVSGTVDVNSLTGPTASASKNVTQPETGKSVKFIGSDSTAGSSSDLSYSWDVNGDGSYEYSGSSPNVTHSYGSSGSYSVELNVSDGNGLWDNASLTVDVQSGTVSRSEAIAAADAWYEPDSSGSWSEQTGNPDYPSSFNFQGSYQPDEFGTDLHAVNSGPNDQTGTQLIPGGNEGTLSSAGHIKIENELQGSMSFGIRSTDFFLGMLINDPTGALPGCGRPGFATTKEATAAEFSCVSPAETTGSWTYFQSINISGEGGNVEASASFSGDLSGSTQGEIGNDDGIEFLISELANDGSGSIIHSEFALIESDSVPTTVKKYFNQNYRGGDQTAPSAVASNNVSQPETGKSVKFIGSDSAAGSSSDLTYSWDVNGDGSYEYTGSSPNVTHSYSSSGTYNVELNVTDSNGLWDNASLTVDVSSATVSRADAIAAADAWYEPTSSGFTQVASNPPSTYPSSISVGGSLNSDFFGSGLDAHVFDSANTADIDNLYFDTGPVNFSLAQKTETITQPNSYLGWESGFNGDSEFGKVGPFGLCSNNQYEIAYPANAESTCAGGDASPGSGSITFQEVTRSPSSEYTTKLYGPSISGATRNSGYGSSAQVPLGWTMKSYNDEEVANSEFAITETRPVPQEIRDYFKENY